jgi:hypothetical protein
LPTTTNTAETSRPATTTQPPNTSRHLGPADQEGLARIAATLERLESAVSSRFRPSEALRATAEAGGFYARFPAGGQP